MPINLVGHTFGRLVVTAPSRKRAGRNKHWKCLCSCGRVKAISYQSLMAGTVSCGCFRRERTAAKNRTHGLSRTKEHKIWIGMRDRCNNPLNAAYRHYGGRGIKVCRRWESFENFILDMGKAPAGRSLERVDNDKGYSPSNCRWATVHDQRRNSRSNILVTLSGVTRCLADWADEIGINRWTVYWRVRRGMKPSKALTTPILRRRSK